MPWPNPSCCLTTFARSTSNLAASAAMWPAPRAGDRVKPNVGKRRSDRPDEFLGEALHLGDQRAGGVDQLEMGFRRLLRQMRAHAMRGDGDPLDICVVTERPINRSEVLVNARIVGGLDVNDGGEADDKIIAVLENDYVWGKAEDISELPPVLVERLRHYFATYKMIPGEPSKLTVERMYGREHALQVVEAAMLDYYEEYGQ